MTIYLLVFFKKSTPKKPTTTGMFLFHATMRQIRSKCIWPIIVIFIVYLLIANKIVIEKSVTTEYPVNSTTSQQEFRHMDIYDNAKKLPNTERTMSIEKAKVNENMQAFEKTVLSNAHVPYEKAISKTKVISSAKAPKNIKNNLSTEKLENNAIPKVIDKVKNSGKAVKADSEDVHLRQEKARNIVKTTSPKKTKRVAKNESPGARIWNEMSPGFLTEDEALTFKQCEDVNTLTSPNTTKLILTDPKQRYKLNDKIKVTIVTHDHYGKPKTEGGDLFIATIKTPSKNASAPGMVTDLQNGTYKVEFDALWTGKAIISVTLTYTKQTIAAAMRFRIKHLPAEYMIAGYEKNNISDTGYCHWNKSMLLYAEICTGNHPVRPYVCKDEGLIPERTEICNFTSANSGTPWYCLRPLKKELACHNWKYISRHNDYPLPGATECEWLARVKIHLKVLTTIEVNIDSQFDDGNKNVVDTPSNPCSNYNKTALWLRREPTGFYYKGIWHLRHCKGVRVDNIVKCMKNKNFYFIGDSTMRQWYNSLLNRYGCNQITEKWTQAKWYKKSICENLEQNFTLTFSMHNLPLFIPNNTDKSIVIKSISSYIDDIADDEKAVFIFHMFTHMNPYHPEFYKLELDIIRNSVENLFRRNKQAKIMIKAPHIFPDELGIMAYQYDRISYEVFYGLFDRIYYLNNIDSSYAEMPSEIHPETVVVDAMLDQALLYSCD